MSSSTKRPPHCDRVPEKHVKLSPFVNLSPDAPQIPYNSKVAKELKSLNVHQGQRKLLMSEIQLLTHYYSKKTVHPWLVYVGAAHGTHLMFLHKLFPWVRFSLWDGAQFDTRLKDIKFEDGSPVFEIHREFFTDKTCDMILSRLKAQKDTKSGGGGGKSLAPPLIFVSDIRSSESNHEAFEAKVMVDMISQERWVTKLEPELSLLKFRLPFTLKEGDKVPYLNGKLFYGIWPPQESAEARLLVKKSDIAKPKVDVDYVTYERVMFHHNSVTRRICFDLDKAPASKFAELLLPAPGKPELGYCRCYDCLSEISVYKNYHDDAAKNADAKQFAQGKFVDLLVAAQSAARNMVVQTRYNNVRMND